MLPFEKMDPAQWYLELIGYKGSGVGFSFGLISEGEMGFGWPDIMIRGVALGALLGWIHNAVIKHSHHFGWIIFYLWLCTRVYLSFRNSTLYWLALVILQLLPAVIFINMVKKRTPVAKLNMRRR